MILSRKQFFYLSLFAFIYILPLLLINIYYIDDLRRSMEGYGWRHDGRELATFIMRLISSGNLSIDFYPYSLILSSVILCFSGFYVSKILGLNENGKFSISSLLLISSPFMLQNLSYRWDSLIMAISIISLILPFFFIDNYKKFIPFSLIGILTSLLTYQASIVVYLLMVLCLIISYCLNKTLKDIIYLLKVSISSLVLAFIFYQIINKILNINFKERGATIFSSSDFIELLYSKILSTTTYIVSSLSITYKAMILIVIVLSIISFLKFVISSKSINLKVISFVSILLVPIGVIFISIILMQPNLIARLFVGFSFIFYALLIFINFMSRKLCNYLSVCLIAMSFPLMTTYANSLKKQNDFEKFLINDIMSKGEIKNKMVVFDGIEPWAPELNVGLNNFPIISEIVPRYLKKDWVWGRVLFQKSIYIKDNVGENPITKRSDYSDIKKNMTIVAKTEYFFMRVNDSIVVVDFGKEENELY